MPTYKCDECSHEVILAKPPTECDICGESVFRTVDASDKTDSTRKPALYRYSKFFQPLPSSE